MTTDRQINAIDATNGAAAIGDGARAVHVGAGGNYIEQQNIYQTIIQPRLEPNLFQVPFLPSDHFVGREADLAQIHALLSGRERRPVGLCGLGGIGKTQLAVEYAYRHRDDYGDGIFWLTAADPWTWQAGLAEIATRLGLAVPDPDKSDAQMRLARELAAYLNGHPNSLLIFDNVEAPADLNVSRVQGFVFAALGCRTLFTTRRRAADLPFAWLEVGRLPEDASLALLLHHDSRRRALDPSHPDHPAAHELCRRLGYLPLTLELAGAFLARNLRVTIPAYLARIGKEGVLATVDRTHLRPEDLPTGHDPSIITTLAMQWEALTDVDARRALQAAALLGEAEQIPRARLALLAGLPDTAEEGYASPLEDALAALRDLSLVEELTADEVRLHPLVREFVASRIADRGTFIETAVASLSEALWNVERLEAETRIRGVDAVVADLRVAVALSPNPSPEVRERGGEAGVRPLLRALDLDSHILRRWNPETEPAFFLQQWRNRCFETGWDEPVRQAEALLAARRLSYLRELRRLGDEHPALVRTLVGHSDSVRTVTVAPDGQWLASGSDDQTVKIWDLASGRMVLNLTGHTATVSCLAISPNGQWIASSSRDGTVRVWDIDTGIQRLSLSHDGDQVLAVAASDDSRVVLSLAGLPLQSRRVIRCWDARTGELLWSAIDSDVRQPSSTQTPTTKRLGAVIRGIMPRRKHPDHDNGSTIEIDSKRHQIRGGIVLISNTPYAAFTSWDNQLRLVDVQRGLLLGTFTDTAQRRGEIRNCHSSADGSHLISAREDVGSVQIWDTTKLDCVEEYLDEAWTRGLTETWVAQSDVAFGPDGKWIVSGGTDGVLTMRYLDGHQPLVRITAHRSVINGLAITPDGHWVVSASDDGSLRVWDVPTLNQQYYRSGLGKVTSMAFSSGGRWLMTREVNAKVTVWDPVSGAPVFTSGSNGTAHINPIVSPDDRLIVSLAGTGLYIWDIVSGDVEHHIRADVERTPFAFFVAQDQCFVIGRTAEAPGVNELAVWLVGSVEPETLLEDADSDAWSVSPDGRWCVSVTTDRRCRFWDMSTRRLAAETNWAKGAPFPVLYNIRFSQNSRWVVLVLADGHFIVRDLLDETPERRLVVPGARSRFMEVTADGQSGFIIEGKDVELWNITSHTLLRHLSGHTAQITDIWSSRDGEWVVSAARDGNIKIWKVSNGRLVASLNTDTPLKLCAIAPDNRFVAALDEIGTMHFLEWVNWERP